MNEDKTVQLTDQEIQYVVNVLAERPYKESAQLITKIVRQVSEAPKAPANDDGVNADL